MIITENPLYTIIPYNKFYPPHIDESQYLLRKPVLSTKLPQKVADRKVVLIEAQAGQGKTTLAYQFLSRLGNEYIWYQIGSEDSDPVFLLATLLANLTDRFPDFSSPQLSYILKQGSIGPQDVFRCAGILLRDLDRYLDNDIYIAFDDVHLIPSIAPANDLLGYLLDASSAKLHFLLISRHPVNLKSKVLRNGIGVSYLKTTDLALSIPEIEDLFNNVLNRTISRRDATEIERITGGWIMGIILARHPVSGRGEFWDTNASPVSNSAEQGHMLEYFQDEILSQIPEFLYVPFLQLSIINGISVDLAVQITGIQDIETILSEMAKKNFFVYRLSDNYRTFRFHHFFQEFLQLRAEKAFAASEVTRIRTMEAEYYLKRNMLEKALACYGNARDYEKMNTILKQQGIQLIENNRTITILSLLQTIPQEIILQYSWLTLYAGMLRIDFEPQQLLPYYEAARTRFIKEGDEVGEIIALAVTIYAHFAVSGQFIRGAKLLARTEELFRKIGNDLPLNVRIIVARNLGVGYNVFAFNMEKANEYGELANELAIRHNMRNFIAYTRFNLSYILLMSGDFALSSQEAEKCFSLTNDPLIAFTNRALLRVMHLCYLSMTGDFHNYLRQQRMFEVNLDQEVIAQTLAAPYMFIWGLSCYIAIGETDKAQELFNRGIDISMTAMTEHMRSQLLQWRAYIHALNGDNDQARGLIKESMELRAIAGGPFFLAFQYILAGAIYTRTGDMDMAAEILDKGIKLAVSLPSPYLHACGLMHAGYMSLLSGDKSAALNSLREGLALMKKHNYWYFWSWEPVMMTRLLGEAGIAGIDRDFVAEFARKRLRLAFAGDGTVIPLLQITLLDHFSIGIGKNRIFTIDDFTVSERELIGLMITAKGQKIDQEKAQLHFWPDSAPDRARKKFDTLLGRLRKKIAESIAPIPVQHYIVSHKGFLCLNNAETDILQFMDACDAGLAHCRNNEWWQASNHFQQALALWKGTLPTDIFTNDYTLSLEIVLLEKFAEVCLLWGDYLAKTNQLNEAIQLLERLLLSNMLEEKAVVMLCDLYIRNNMPLKVGKLIERYKKALTDVDYSEEEVEKIIARIVQRYAAPAKDAVDGIKYGGDGGTTIQ